MKSLNDALRHEITRLARKEVKAQLAPLHAASSRHRSEIAELKRALKDLERRLGYLERQERKRVGEPAAPDLAEGSRFSRKGLKSHRARLGLSAADYALLAGTSAQTIYSYERGLSRPRPAQLAKLVALRSVGKREAERRLALLKE